MELNIILPGVLAILVIYLFKKYFIDVYKYWKERGFPSVPGPLPVLGHTISMFFSHQNIAMFMDEIYASNKNRSMVGFYQLWKPSLVLLDPELIKSVLINDFSKFQKHFLEVEKSVDPLLTEDPTFNSGDKWKITRDRFSHSLMSSKKLRIFGNHVEIVSQKCEKYLKERMEKSKNGILELAVEKLGKSFTGEISSRAIFSVNGDFFIEGTGPNSFREAVQELLNPSLANKILYTFLFIAPKVYKMLGLPFISKKMDNFFHRLVRENVEARQKDGIPRADFLQMLIDGHKCEDEKDHLNIECLTAVATSFFIDGSTSSGITVGFFLYVLAKYPEVQEKVREEVLRVLDKHEGRICYDSITEMTYTEQALSECQRLFPAVAYLEKICNAPCKFVGFDGLEYEIKSGTEVMIPVYSIHRDERYYENPEVFDPDRFRDERKKDRPKSVFLPFSEGPRSCVGMRIAQMQVKAAIATVLKDYFIELSPRNKEPLTFNRGIVFLSFQGDVWINLKKR